MFSLGSGSKPSKRSNQATNSRPAPTLDPGPVPGGRPQLLCGKPSAWLGPVIIPDAENGNAEARIDSIDDAAPFGFDDMDAIAKFELAIHRGAFMAMLWQHGGCGSIIRGHPMRLKYS